MSNVPEPEAATEFGSLTIWTKARRGDGSSSAVGFGIRELGSVRLVWIGFDWGLGLYVIFQRHDTTRQTPSRQISMYGGSFGVNLRSTTMGIRTLDALYNDAGKRVIRV